LRQERQKAKSAKENQNSEVHGMFSPDDYRVRKVAGIFLPWRSWLLGVLGAILLVPIIINNALAVSTSHWVQTNEADFKPGQFHNVVATNLGELKLSRAVKTLLEQDPKVSSVYSLAEGKDGTIYAGTGPQGVLLQIKDDKVSTVTELGDGVNIFSLLVDHDGALLVGTGGDSGKIYRIAKSGDKPNKIFDTEDAQYIWSMCQTDDGNIYAATGPNGKLFEIKPDGSHSVILSTDENNLLSMISDGKDTLYVGTDPDGLVYRVNRKTHESFVLYDAAESGISAMALDKAGNLYVGTAEASEQTAPAEDTGAKDKIGRPEGGGGGVPIQSQPPANPAPPTVPNPNPGEPNPIPKKMMIMDDPGGGGGDPNQPNPPEPGNPPTPGNPTPKNPGENTKPGTQPAQQGINTTGTGQPTPQGNAIYKIDPNGFVREIFRQPVLVLSIVEHDGTLLVATGSEGLVYQVNPAQEETAVIAKVDPKQVTSLLMTHDNQIIMGFANVGGLAKMGAGFASDGTFLSPVQDATQISTFGKIHLHGSLPPGTTLTLATRSGNVKEPTDTDWSKWSDEQPATEFVQTNSPSARFFQYRLTFATKDEKSSPIVESVDTAYLMPNLPPLIKGVKVTLGSKNAPATPPPDATDQNQSSANTPVPNGRIQTITWDASDPNDDPLVFTLYFRNGSKAPWILLKDKIKDTSYEWDTRTVADGRYEIKVVASDAAANPVGQGKTASRISDPVMVDNTPPVVGDVKTDVKGSTVKVDCKGVDQTSTVEAMDYAVDSAQDWQAATPSDKMFDSPEAAATFTVTGLSPGPHQITVRATDARGNQGFQTVTVTIEPPTASK
jgi:hypothetical protein